MRLTYFHYYLHARDETVRRYIVDFDTVLNDYCRSASLDIKDSAMRNDEHLYIQPVVDRTYLFLMTGNQEIIKSVATGGANVSDIYQKLAQNETLGFASYVWVAKEFYGVASTIHGPKNTAFVEFLTYLMKSKGVSGYRIASEALLATATRLDVLRFPVIGRTQIELDPNGTVARQIAGLLGFGNMGRIDSLEVVIKPKRKANIKDVAKAVSERVSDDDALKYIMKAKATLDDNLTDFFVVGSGALGDQLSGATNDQDWAFQIKRAADGNSNVETLLEKTKLNGDYVTTLPENLNPLLKPGDWIGS